MMYCSTVLMRLLCFQSILQSDSYQDDIYPLTAGAQPAMTAQEWLNGFNKGQSCTCSGKLDQQAPMSSFLIRTLVIVKEEHFHQ